jgi:hypothetical protein
MKSNYLSVKLFVLAFSLMVTFLLSNSVSAQTITSTPTGGLWSSAATWVGGVVPSASSDVTINGIVKLNGDFTCNNLTVNASGSLMNEYGWNPTFTANGKIINNGSIIKNPDGYSFYMNVVINIENNGVWSPSQTRFTGNNDQRIKQSAGKSFQGYFATTDTLGQIILESNVTFDSNIWDWNKSKLQTNGFSLTALNYVLNSGSIISNDKLVLKNTIIAAMNFSGNYQVDGKFRLRDGNVFNGTATVLDTMLNEYGYNPTLTVNGKIINNGTVIRNPAGYSFYLNIFSDVENNGKWAPSQTTFSGTANQKLKQSAGKSFQGYFLTTDTVGQIVLESNITFDSNTWDWNKSKLQTNGFSLITQNYVLNNGFIISNDKLVFKNTAIAAMTISGKYQIDGKFRVRDGNIFNGTATVLDTLINEYGYNPILTVNGKIINNGKIIRNPAGYSLYLNIFSDVENNGTWSPSQTTLSGLTNQKLKQSAGKSFQGYFLTTDTVGQIVLESNITFDGNTWDWNKSKLQTNGFSLTAQNYLLNNGTIISNDNLVFKNTLIGNMTFFGNYKLEGKFRVKDGNVFNGTATVIDTIYNEYGWNPTITVNGKIINNGTISKNPSGYSFYLNLFSDVENNGFWSPSQTTFSGNTDQKLKQSKGKSFQGYFVATDSIGDIVLNSNITFEGNSWEMNKCRLQTNNFQLTTINYLLNNGKILSNDTLNLKNSRLKGMTFNGNYKLRGLIEIQDGVIFNDNVTVLDTIYNHYGWNPTIVVKGNLINNGTIRNNPSGYSLHLSIYGNLENNHKFNVSNVYLSGTGDRTISGKFGNAILGNFYADGNISLVKENILPNLNFTGSPGAGCTVKSDAILTLLSLPNTSKVKNYGRITLATDVDNAGNNTYNFYASSVNTKAKTEVGKITIDNYGYQQHPTATGTVNTWWRLRNTPQLFNDSLNWLKLSYSEDALNGNNEDSLKVFHSPNSGMNWKRIKSEITIDKVNNLVTITKAPSYGHYLLSSSALGITNFQPLLESAEPRFGGNTGQLTMYLFGAGFKATSKVKLKLAGQNDIIADSTWLTDAIGESMLARFNLKNKMLGIYDVVIETPGEKSFTLPTYFEIEKGERSNPWAMLTGRNRFLINRWQTFNIGYGNQANTDALGTVLVFVVNDLPGLEVVFPDLDLSLPEVFKEMGPYYTRIKDSVNIYYLTDTLSGYENIKMRVYPFYIPNIRAGSSKTTPVKIKLNGNGSLKMESWILDPLYEDINTNLKSAQEDLPPQVKLCLAEQSALAVYKAFYEVAGVVVPAADCWGVIDKVLNPIEKAYTTPETRPEPDNSLKSWFWYSVSVVGSGVQCAAGVATRVNPLALWVRGGIALTNIMIDVSDKLDMKERCWAKFRKLSQNKLNSNGVTSFDPNEKVGPQGYTSEHYISKEGNINYTIFFENKKTAGAAALEVFVTDTLDSKKFDFNTFSFSNVTFGDTTIKIQEFAKEFKILVDLYPKKNIIVQIHGKLDVTTGVVSWDFHSLDRVTLELTEDPDLGFLPPNATSPEGEGNVTFSCKLKNTVAHGDVISNRASIIFDFNAPILTNTFTNKIDDRIPFSSVSPLAASIKDTLINVSWTGSDMGSKIKSYNIFVSTNDSAYVLWKVAKEEGNAVFKGKDGYKYKFFSVATDSIGFAENMKSTPEAVTILDLNTSSEIQNLPEERFNLYPNPAKQVCNLMFYLTKESVIEISVSDISGKKILMKEPQEYGNGKQIIELQLGNLTDGVYIVKFSVNQNSCFQKLLIRN